MSSSRITSARRFSNSTINQQIKMKITRRLSATGLTIVLLAGLVGCGKSRTGTAEQKTRFEGNWSGFDVTQPAEVCKVTITGNQLEYRGAQSNDWCVGSFILDESAQPKQMDLTVQGPPEIAGKVMLFIYQQQGNEMKVSGAASGLPLRLVDFSPSQQSRVWSFKRE